MQSNAQTTSQTSRPLKVQEINNYRSKLYSDQLRTHSFTILLVLNPYPFTWKNPYRNKLDKIKGNG